MAKTTVSPAGFAFGDNNRDEFSVVALTEINDLAKEYREMRTQYASIDYVERLVYIAKRVLGNNPLLTLASLYERGSLVSDCEHNYAFLTDTRELLMTGKRSMGISTRVQLMEFHSEYSTLELNAIHRTLLGKARKLGLNYISTLAVGDNMYTHWLKQPHGLNDMLCTLVVLFGNTNQLCCNN